MRRSMFVLPLALALLFAGAEPSWSADPVADPFAGKWTLTYHLNTKPGHETYAVPESPGTTVVQKAYTTHVSQPEFAVNPDGTFAFAAYDTGCNVNETDATSPTGAGTALGKHQVYLKAKGKVDGDVIHLTLDQAFGNGEIKMESGGSTIQANITTSPNSNMVTQVTRGDFGASTHQIAKSPGGYTPHSTWGSQKWELKKKSAEGDKTIYSAAPRDVQLAGGLKVVETVEVQQDTKVADLSVSLGSEETHQEPGSTGTVTAVVTNNGPSEARATLKLRVVGGDVFGHDYTESHVEVQEYTGGTSEVAIQRIAGWDEYKFTYEFTLPSGASRTVKVKAKDKTTPGQTVSYAILFQADVTGSLPDPNSGNNFANLLVVFDPPKKTPPKPTPTKAK